MSFRIIICGSLVLVAVAGADVGLVGDQLRVYGSLRPEAIARGPEGGDLLRRMDDGYSRVGVSGETEIDDRWTGFYRYERRVSANDGEDDGAVRGDTNELRQVHGGVRGPYGSLAMGRHYGLYYDYIDDELDRHRSHYSDAIVFGDLFVSNAVIYRSPDLGVGDFGALVEFNDGDASGEAVGERFEFAGTLRLAGVALHAGYVASPEHDGLLGLALSRPVGPLTLTGLFQRLDRGAATEALFSAAVDVDLGPRRGARLAVTMRRDDPDRGSDDLYFIGGVDQRLSAELLAFVEVFSRAADADGADETALVTGLRFEF